MNLLRMKVFRSVEGLSHKFNDIIYKSPIERTDNRRIVCYFGGDVQDFDSNMNVNKDSHQFKDYSLEKMCELLSLKFKTSDILVIRANRFHENTYAIYEHFVDSNSFGCPKHQFTKHSLTHLRLLLINCFNQLDISLDFSNNEKLILIGFSKGCVVLNQFLYAFYVSLEDLELKNLIQSIECMYWCDGGHSGGSNTWITSRDVLKNFSKLNIKVKIHVTPYQVKCLFRPWIAKEEKKFFDLLTELGVNVERVLHFSEEEKSLEMHFKVLNEFVK